jgi:GNAT superfamily N-acetyltransferase
VTPEEAVHRIFNADPMGQGEDCFIIWNQGARSKITVCKDRFSEQATTPDIEDGWSVTEITVHKDMRRRGIGTRLWEAAMREACKRGGPFRSDVDRRGNADRFWEKQLRKKRVKQVQFVFDADKRSPESFFEIDCGNMPTTLERFRVVKERF